MLIVKQHALLQIWPLPSIAVWPAAHIHKREKGLLCCFGSCLQTLFTRAVLMATGSIYSGRVDGQAVLCWFSCWWGRKSVCSLQVCPVQSSASSVLTDDLAEQKWLISPLSDWAAFSYSRLLWLLFDLSNEVLVIKFGKYKICTLNTILPFYSQMTNILNA